MEVQVKETDAAAAALHAQRDGQVRRHSALAYAPLARENNVYVLNTQKVVVHGPRVVVALATTTLTIHPAGTLMLFRLIRHFDYLFQ